tara:strand:- start:215 stop:616 length:402 start_codon:yes stop_codon:yes gene_type:complete
MAFKQKGFPMHATKSALKAHPSDELYKLKADVDNFLDQFNENPNEDTHADLQWARQALDEYMSGGDGGDHGDPPPPPTKQTSNEPTKDEKLEIKRHYINLEKHPELYKDPFYDKRKKVVESILAKYPNYKWDK